MFLSNVVIVCFVCMYIDGGIQIPTIGFHFFWLTVNGGNKQRSRAKVPWMQTKHCLKHSMISALQMFKCFQCICQNIDKCLSMCFGNECKHCCFCLRENIHSLVTLSGTHVEFNAIQYNISVINSTFTRIKMLSFWWHFITKVILPTRLHYNERSS